MSDKKSQPNVAEMLAMAKDFKFDDPDKQRQCQLMLKRLNIQIGDRSFEDLDDDIDFLNDLLTVIDLINERYEKSDFFEPFDLGLSVFDGIPAVFYHGKYYRVKDRDDGEFFINLKDQIVSPYFKNAETIIEDNNELFVYGQNHNGERGVFDQEGMMVAPNDISGFYAFYCTKSGNDFYVKTSSFGLGMENSTRLYTIECLTDKEKKFDRYASISEVRGVKNILIGHKDDDDIGVDVIDLNTGKTVPFDFGPEKFRFTMYNNGKFCLAFSHQKTGIQLIDPQTKEVLLTAKHYFSFESGAETFLGTAPPLKYFDNRGEEISHFGDKNVHAIGRDSKGRLIFVASVEPFSEDNTDLEVIDAKGNVLAIAYGFDNALTGIYQTKEGYVFKDGNSFYDSEHNLLLQVSGEIKKNEQSNGQLFVASYDSSTKKAEGRFIEL
ncbi:hypothetical protein COT97_00855 [Candidatus Falkowbacteria bacterium CG10_big_fil_rev_8_21_14_0_10_39_11]|uniref:WG repeat-containing protein n=1 Tax=Candidatus Falkowbacteria bacterium CG10_big_fil_rev_8_21_14_0_10_39_11 TaxID=1974565 RepID=A0A2H0V5Y9_9BACT|nr:MAG: hypothetical protein COT97_00855 [Candidatus Falkowbacteria bacterium CG10_big_fil_rev_8_21_14_0_10_39_11]